MRPTDEQLAEISWSFRVDCPRVLKWQAAMAEIRSAFLRGDMSLVAYRMNRALYLRRIAEIRVTGEE